MNSDSFYLGVISELNKRADELPKKHNWLAPALGAGALGLGGLAAYKHFKNPGSTAVPPVSAVESAPVSNTLNNVAGKAYTAGAVGSTAQGVGAMASSIKNKLTGNRMPFLDRFSKLPGMNRLFGLGDSAMGAANVVDSINNPDNNNLGVRTAQGLGGAAQTGLGALGIANKFIPAATSGLGKTLLSKVPMSASMVGGGLPVLAASAVQGELGLGGMAAESHSQAFSSAADSLVKLQRAMKSGDPQTVETAKGMVHSIFKDPTMLNNVTNPDGLARIGYNPLGMGRDPDFTSFNHILERLRREAQQ